MIKRLMFLTVICASLLGISMDMQAQDYDVVLENGRVLDGTGNPWYYADVAINNGRIAAVGDLKEADTERRINIEGKYISPGFIDIHSHSDGPLFGDRGLRSDNRERRTAPNLVSQGITTVVVNQDGRSPREISISDQIKGLLEPGTGVNVGVMVGHGTLRYHAMGDDYQREATDEEIAEMKKMLREGLEQGAYGLSAGLEYVPGRWSETSEVVELAKELVPYNGVYISHQRSEAETPMRWLPSSGDPNPPTAADAVKETIEIGRESGAVVVASHIKSRGTTYWGGSERMISLINQARADGVRIYADQYPYNTSGSDGSVTLIPRWAFNTDRWEIPESEKDDYRKPLRKVLTDEELTQQLEKDIKHIFAYRGGAKNITVFDHPVDSLIGRNVDQIAESRNSTPVETAIWLQMNGYPDERGGGRLRSFSMKESDIEAFAKQPWMATTTDGGIALEEDGPDVHARFYGTFPRKIRKYAIEEQAISVEHAVRSSTSLPAQILGLGNRGEIEVDNWADLVVFDINEINDEADFFDPHQHSSGIEYVFINGTPVVDDGERTSTLPGKIISPENDKSETILGG